MPELSTASTPPLGLFSAREYRDFRIYFVGHIVSVTGTWVQIVAVQWLVYRLTHSSAMLGVVGFIEQIPVLILATSGGVVADRFKRRRVLTVTQSAMMMLSFGLAALTFSGRVATWHVLVIAGLFGAVNAFDMPASQAFVFDLVGRRDLQRALGLGTSMRAVARCLGSALAGLLLAQVGEGWCFLTNGISFVVVLASLFSIRDAPSTPRPPRGTMVEEIRTGVSYVGRTSPVRAALLVVAVVMFASSPYVTLMPVFGDKVLHGGPLSFGLLTAAVAAGAIVASARIFLARRGRFDRETSIGISTVVLSVAVIGFSLSRLLPLSLALLTLVGYSATNTLVICNALIQSVVPHALRGRVMSLWVMVFMGVQPLGALAGGGVASTVGPQLAGVMFGLVSMAGGVIYWLRAPALRDAANAALAAATENHR